MDRKTRSRGRQRKGPRRLLRPWEPRLAVTVVVAAALAGPGGAAAGLAAPVNRPDAIQPSPPASALALAILGLTVLAWLVVAARRFRHRKSGPEDATLALPHLLPPMSDLDLDLIVSGARASGGRVRDGRGSQAGDRSPEEPGSPNTRTAGAPVWVRRLDDRIPIMPTHQNVPVDNDEPAGRPGRVGPRRSRGRGGS